MPKRILIIGAGPTGIGAAVRLDQVGHPDWQVYERAAEAGGLAGSIRSPAGFTWDIGGHVVFSHYPEFDRFLEQTLGGETLQHERESWIRIFDRWVPYPFQNNIRHLPPEVIVECLLGLARVYGGRPNTADFEQWIYSVFGAGIARHFMLPYNRKVWAVPPAKMSAAWIAERVSVVDLERVLRNVVFGKDDISWGPNNKFSFPLHGGTGEIYRRAARRLGERVAYSAEVVEVDTAARTVRLADGRTDTYDVLINTMPLTELVPRLRPARPPLAEAAARLAFSGGYIVGLGLARPYPTTKCWTYYPEASAPFYRLTFFHNYSPNNVPGGDVQRYCALMCETSYSPDKPEDRTTIVERTIAGCIAAGVLAETDREQIVDRFLIDIPYSYPIPTLERDAGLAVLQPALEQLGILSRGRFGAWRYEIGNMDHSFMMGWEAVERALHDAPEKVFHSKG